ncbi:MAG: hypothetical protein ACK4M3_01155 [Pyrobaculum sp.]
MKGEHIDVATNSEKEKNRKKIIAFIALAAVALIASQTFVIGLAEAPPAEAAEIYIGGERLAVDSGTYIFSIVGYVGHLTNYTDVVKICGNRDMEVVLHYRGAVGSHERHVATLYVYWSDVNQGVGFIGKKIYDSASVYIPAGQCRSLAVSILLTPDMPPGTTAIYQIDIEMRRR